MAQCGQSGRPAHCGTLSRSPALFRHPPPSSDCKRLQRTLGPWTSCPRSLTQGREPHEQPAVTSSGKGISPSRPDFWDHQEAWGGVWAGAGRGAPEGPQTGHWLSQSCPLSDELSNASGHPFIQQTFIETQNKESSVRGLRFSLKSPWEDGEGLINGRLSRRPQGEGAFQGLSPAHQPAKVRLSGPGPASPPGNLKNSGGIHHL